MDNDNKSIKKSNKSTNESNNEPWQNILIVLVVILIALIFIYNTSPKSKDDFKPKLIQSDKSILSKSKIHKIGSDPIRKKTRVRFAKTGEYYTMPIDQISGGTKSSIKIKL